MSGPTRVIGIDLGTTNSCVAIVEHGDPLVIPNNEGSHTTPSVVAFTADGERLVGQIARRQAVINPDRTLFAVKRLIGRRFDDPEVQRTRDLVPYAIIEADNGDAWVRVNGEKLPPPKISAMVLQHLRSVAESYLGDEVTEAVVTVPAYFNDAQRQATKDAARIAGLKIQRIINEPTAAALAYGLGRKEHERIAVFDLGGGTFDISILEVDGGVFQVKATNGDTFLGGEDFDNRLLDWLLREFEQREGIDLRDDKIAVQRLKEAAEKAKHELSNAEETDINLPFVASGESGPIHLLQRITRGDFEAMVADLIDRLTEPCLHCLADAGMTAEDLDAVLLVGGMTRMPRVQRKVTEIFGREPERGINPDEVVAIGAAIQGAVLAGEVKDILLLDVTPLTLGIEIAGGIMEPIIPRNTTIPCRKSKVFTTATDNQDMVRVHILQGEREMADDNKSLGVLEMHGLPPAPRGVPEIEVSFEIDADGILNVRAHDRGTGKAQAMRIVGHSGLDDAEVEEMIRDAEKYRTDDQARRKLAEAKNQLDALIYNTSRIFEEFGHSLGDQQELVQDAIEAAEDAMDATDIEYVLQAHQNLFAAAQHLADAIYGGVKSTIDEELDQGALDDEELDQRALDDEELDDASTTAH